MMPKNGFHPWFDHQVPFVEAAEVGTKKVKKDHSTIGLVVTTDGSITDIGRDDYIEAEERVINELKGINKPFVVLLNSTSPGDAETESLRQELEEKYQVPVIAANCAQLKIEDLNSIMEGVLLEFPIREIGINFSKWIESLEDNHWLKVDMINAVKDVFRGIGRIREIKGAVEKFDEYEFIKKAYVDNINLGSGNAIIEINVEDGLLYRVLTEMTEIEISGEHELISIIKDLARVKKEYDKIEFALNDVKLKGYGIVTPQITELTLEQPEIVKQGSRFGVKLRASAPSIHMISNKRIFKFIRNNQNRGQKPYEINIEVNIGLESA